MIITDRVAGSDIQIAGEAAVTVKAGQNVSQNQMIGNVGTTGYVTGAHVHFEVRLPSGVQVNPINYLIGY